MYLLLKKMLKELMLWRKLINFKNNIQIFLSKLEDKQIKIKNIGLLDCN
jgi:hypothetical protein